MTDTALIGSSCALGVFWSSKRYFDYLIDETNLSLPVSYTHLRAHET